MKIYFKENSVFGKYIHVIQFTHECRSNIVHQGRNNANIFFSVGVELEYRWIKGELECNSREASFAVVVVDGASFYCRVWLVVFLSVMWQNKYSPVARTKS